MIKSTLNKLLLLALCFITSLNACKTIKSNDSGEKIKIVSLKKLLETLNHNDLDVKWIKGRGSASINFEENVQEVDLNLRIKNDSLIWLNLSKYKKKIARTSFGYDSVKITLEYPEKYFYLSSFKTLSNSINLSLSYEIIQELLIGGSFISFVNDKFISNIKENQYHLSSHSKRKSTRIMSNKAKQGVELIYQSWIDPVNFKCNRVNIFFPESSSEIDIQYEEWTDIENQLFPQKIKVKMSSFSNEYSLEIAYKSIKFDLPQRFPEIKIDDKYQPLIIND